MPDWITRPGARPVGRSPLLPAVALLMSACAATGQAGPPFTLEVTRQVAVASLDSLPDPEVAIDGGRLVIHGHFGLGSAGYRLTPVGTIEDGVVDVLVSAELPEETFGAEVLTDYVYLLTTIPLARGRWRVRLHHAIATEGDPEFMLDREFEVR